MFKYFYIFLYDMATPIFLELDDQLNRKIRKKAREEARTIKATVEILIRRGLTRSTRKEYVDTDGITK